MRKNCSNDREQLFLITKEQFIQTVKGQYNFGNKIPFFTFSRRSSSSKTFSSLFQKRQNFPPFRRKIKHSSENHNGVKL